MNTTGTDAAGAEAAPPEATRPAAPRAARAAGRAGGDGPRRGRRPGACGAPRGPAVVADRHLPASGEPPRVVRRPPLGRGAARRHPPGAARTRRSTPATCSTCRPRCGTPGRPTTRRRTATSSPRSTAPSDVAAARERGDQLRRLPRPDARATSRPSAATSRSREFADVMDALCYPLDVDDDRGRLAGGGRQPDRRGRPRLRR